MGVGVGENASSGIRCIVGLGNPGAQYAATRHNVGAWFVDRYSEKNNIPLCLEKKFRALVGAFSDHCFLFRPTTYMNESGASVSVFTQFYKINPEEMLVVHDELDFEPGIARLKQGGGHGGHNGLRDIISHLGPDFYRLRIGIGHPGHRDDVTNYVLGNPSYDDHEKIISALTESLRVIPALLLGEFQKAFHALHS